MIFYFFPRVWCRYVIGTGFILPVRRRFHPGKRRAVVRVFGPSGSAWDILPHSMCGTGMAVSCTILLTDVPFSPGPPVADPQQLSIRGHPALSQADVLDRSRYPDGSSPRNRGSSLPCRNKTCSCRCHHTAYQLPADPALLGDGDSGTPGIMISYIRNTPSCRLCSLLFNGMPYNTVCRMPWFSLSLDCQPRI